MSYIERYWRDAKPEDAIKDPPMVARFRSAVGVQWRIEKLNGYNRKLLTPWGGDEWWFSTCQVYDAPDPGEGWRLIDIDKDKPQEGDQYCEAFNHAWHKRDIATASFAPKSFYRRRITPPEPKYVPFTWEDRKELQGRIVQLHWETGAKQELLLHHFTLTTDGRFEIAKVDAERMLKIGVFLDTGKPVGKLIN